MHFLLLMTLMLGGQQMSVTPIQAADLFPFGPLVGDYENAATDDALPEDKQLPTPVKVAGNMYTHFTLSPNGFMHFQGELPNFNLADSMLPGSVQLIGLGVDVDTRDQGHLYGRQVDDASTLQELENDIHLVDPKFSASWATILTWCTVEGYSLPEDLLNSFQVIMVYDVGRQKTFGILNYNRIDWLVTPVADFEAGFNSGDPATSLSLKHPSTVSESEFKGFIMTNSNVGIIGRYVLRIDGGSCVAQLQPQMAIDDGSWIAPCGQEPFVRGESMQVKCRPNPHDWTSNRTDIEVQCWNSPVGNYDEEDNLATVSLGLDKTWDGQTCQCTQVFTGCTATFTLKEDLGVSCGGHTCAPAAVCIGRKCECRHERYNRGNGDLVCHSDKYLSTFLENDPSLTTINGQHASLPVPCRYDFTEVTSVFRNDSGDVTGVCRVHVKAFNRKVNGKFYVHGVDTAIRVEHYDETVSKVSVRNYGVATNGFYSVNLRTDGTQNAYSPDGPFLDDDVSAISWYDSDLEMFLLHARGCGVFVLFRAFNVVTRRATQRFPGVVVVVDTAHTPHFVNNGAMLALLPASQGQSPAYIEQLPPANASFTHRIVYRALSSNVAQVKAGNILKHMSCDAARAKALQDCSWMLQSPKFVRCYDASINGQFIMHLFNDFPSRCEYDALNLNRSATDTRDTTSIMRIFHKCILVSKGSKPCFGVQQLIRRCDSYTLKWAYPALKEFMDPPGCTVTS